MKKLAAFFIIVIISVFGVAAAPVSGGEEKRSACFELPIVMYHNTHRKTNTFTVSPKELENDMLWVRDHGFTTVTLAEVIAFKETGVPLPEKPIMLTFDDGYQNNYYNAFPLFKKYSMKCVMSVVGELIDRNYQGDKHVDTRAHLNYEQIKEMHGSGLVEIQNHTYDLHKIGRRYGIKKIKGENSENYKAMLKNDLLKAHQKILENTGITMNAVAFPFGGYSKEAFEILREMGYKAALTCNEGLNKLTCDSDLFLLKRVNRPSGPSSERFFSKMLVK